MDPARPPSFCLLALSLLMRRHTSSHSVGHRSHRPHSWMPSLVYLVAGGCEGPKMQCSWPKGPLLAIGF
uniref:Secreted protein n=1 Tax=Catagonus wagneri TaxID=51154 RepID=A0A8C3X766_9CETA